MMVTTSHNANGHRRRQLTRRVWAEEHACALCDQAVDKTLKNVPGEHGKTCPTSDCTGCIPHPLRGEVDEDLPRSRGGSPYERSNCHLMHRKCNQFKADRTLAEARAALHATSATVRRVQPSPIW